ncbi:LysE family translocator [Roseateles cellulosilyticus]|uniref:LysE family translocator n=1 Tax=Pelomonas cellulosilytica TaxID=2906762 RepID=A0ABS8XRF1_9BURK|nr:LysE family translocator [Pelomonas sp. P8]MCE4553482.1 LysE family translocator [Pelomonas sp. P8]
MPSATHWLLFAGSALLMAVTPGPNMIYLISRALCQGRKAGVLSWLGVVLGFGLHMVCAALGLTALFLAVPLGYEVLKFAGGLYLLWLAWQALRPGARSPFEPRPMAMERPARLFAMGLLTSVLNPKVAMFYLSVLPQFVVAKDGAVLAQSLMLGATQVGIGASVNLAVTLFAAGMVRWFARHRVWLAVQRHLMGVVLGALAIRLISQQRSAA